MRIRRDSDDSETDIGFNGSGDLDTSAIATHCGSSNGYCVTWMDQSGNGNDAEQSTNGSQPQIYDGSAVITYNGKPSLEFDGSNDRLRTSQLSTVAQPTTRIGVSRFDNVGTLSGYLQDGHTLRQVVGCDAHVTARWRLFSGTVNDYTEYAAIDTQYLSFGIFDNASTNLSVNGSNLGNKSVGTQGFDGVTIGASAGSSTVYFDGGIQEIIVYPDSQSSNRSGIETNINDYFSIY